MIACTEKMVGALPPNERMQLAGGFRYKERRMVPELWREKAGVSDQARVAVTRSLKRFASATRERLLNIT